MRRKPLHYQDEEKAHFQKMIECGAIEPSSSDWASAPVLVRTKDSKVRWCMDYRMLNKYSRRKCQGAIRTREAQKCQRS